MFSKNFEKEIGTKKIYCEYTSISELMKYYFCFVQLEMILYKSTKVGEKMRTNSWIETNRDRDAGRHQRQILQRKCKRLRGRCYGRRNGGRARHRHTGAQGVGTNAEGWLPWVARWDVKTLLPLYSMKQSLAGPSQEVPHPILERVESP